MQGNSGSGSVLTVSREDNLALSSEDSSSSTPGTECDCDLGLDLSIGVGDLAAACSKLHRPSAKILTAQDLPDAFCSSSTSSTLSRVNGMPGSKRAADSIVPSNASSQVKGWPPVRASRINGLSNSGRSPSNKDFNSLASKSNAKIIAKHTNSDCGRGSNPKQRLLPKSSYVKVNMDGIAIGRKVNLTAHDSYVKLAHTLQKMFDAATGNDDATREECNFTGSRFAECPSFSGTISSKLIDGSSGYVITYEDKDGDWMLVGDVPWRMFLNTVRRLRIMRNAEAKGISVYM